LLELAMSDSDLVVRRVASPLAIARQFMLSSVGSKVLMALTGLGLWGFVIGHLVGNLQVFTGSGTAINEYGKMLHELGHGVAIWVVRAGLLGCFALHIVLGIRLAANNRAARPVAYKSRNHGKTNAATLYMAFSGSLILLFLVFHLAHFTWHWVPATTYGLDATGTFDVYKMVVTAFKNPGLVAIYIVGQGLLFAHLFHGTQSLWQSLGMFHPVWTPVLGQMGRLIAGVILLGNVAIPVAILALFNP
jgi:succinate dehydrogenase / fumarate reductase, cytochrome b subunit